MTDRPKKTDVVGFDIRVVEKAENSIVPTLCVVSTPNTFSSKVTFLTGNREISYL